MRNSQPRFYLIDILRLLAILAIVPFHTYNFLHHHDLQSVIFSGTVFNGMIEFARFFVVGGFIVVAISFFLLGFKKEALNSKKLRWLIALGMGLLLVTQGERPFQEFYLEWDIYHLLLLGLASVLALQNSRRLWLVATLIGFIFLWIPFWNLTFFQTSPLFVQHILIGVCDSEGRGGWAVLPWLGLIWFSFGAGKLAKENLVFLRAQPSRYELGIAAAILGLSLFFKFQYHSVPIGYEFSCFTHRQSPVAFWSEMVWIFYGVRLAFVSSLNKYLQTVRLVQFVANLNWSKSFGLCYFIHLMLLSLSMLAVDWFSDHPTRLAALSLFILIGTEFLARLILQIPIWLRNGFLSK